AMTAAHHNMLTVITFNENILIPEGRDRFHKVNHKGWLICEVVGSDAEVLNGCLEQYGCCQLEDFGSATNRASVIVSVVAFVEQYWSEVHRSDTVANKGMQRCVKGFLIVGMLGEDQVFRCEYCLATSEIGVHPFPSSWEGTS